MTPPLHRLLRAAAIGIAAALGAAVQPALAQEATRGTAASSRADGYSLLPWTRRGYVGLNIGRSDYDDYPCAPAAGGCDDSGTRIHLYTGGLFNDWVGMELGYLNEGGVRRNGGRMRSEGVNVSAVGRLPFGAFNVFAKGGVTYGRTRVSSTALSGVPAGDRRGWGRSFGVGAGWDFTPRQGVVLEWSRHEFRLPGTGGRFDADGVSLGYVQRF